MSEQDSEHSSTKQRRSRKTSTANQQNGKQALTSQRPANDDRESWKTHWKIRGQSWRTEPEIDEERQKYLAERRSIAPYTIPNLFPFKDIKLHRADVEWLLATHENGRGPIDWKDEKQREREGIDLRGADLRSVDLSKLPMACLVGGLRQGDDATVYYSDLQEFEGEIAAIHLEGANLNEANLEGGDLRTAHLEGADLSNVHLEGVSLKHAHLEGADLRGAFMSSETALNDVTLCYSQNSTALLADVHWSDVNVSVVNWSALSLLGDELLARQNKSYGTEVDELYSFDLYATAVRAYRQLSIVLRNQGLNEDAARFAYRAQRLQRIVLRRQRKIGQYLFSGFLDLIAGYGYKPGRSVLWYLGIIALFAVAYHLFGGLSLYPPDALVYSLTSFHGRGFFPGLSAKPSLHDPLILLAALEAVIGLFIEISFIATFTQRFLGK